jgi:hypothetical protein
MPILNYTTSIEAIKTAGEIQGLLAAKGAACISIAYQSGEPTALQFVISVKGYEINFRLPCNIDGVHSAMKRDRKCPPRFQSREQAKKVAWRIVKDWVEAQLAIIESGQAEMAEVFLPYAVLPETGQTLFQRITSDPSRMLGAGSLE